MSGHLDGPPPGPQDPPYIPGDLGAPSAKEFARRRPGDRHMSDKEQRFCPQGDADRVTRRALLPPGIDLRDEGAIRADERERLSARVYGNGWCPTCGRAVSAGSDGEDRPDE